MRRKAGTLPAELSASVSARELIRMDSDQSSNADNGQQLDGLVRSDSGSPGGRSSAYPNEGFESNEA